MAVKGLYHSHMHPILLFYANFKPLEKWWFNIPTILNIVSRTPFPESKNKLRILI